MFLVTGGYGYPDLTGGYGYLDSTETFDPLVGSWATSSAKLPRPMYGVRAEIISNRLLIFGKSLKFPIHISNLSLHLIHAGGNDEWDFYDDIVEYDPEKDTITTVGHMIKARGFHAVSVVDASEYTKWCDGST